MSFMRLYISSCPITRVVSKSQFLTNKLHTSSQATFPEQLRANISMEPPEISGSATEKSYPAHIIKLANEVCQLTLMEVADLSELLQKKLNLKVLPRLSNRHPGLLLSRAAQTGRKGSQATRYTVT
ncbi:hypothetical protein AHF37_06538 [Paragonimus kellicotti]|nr:hypothetical protein AHF37_06538 [Paragonimus kellicotti]